jgi:CRP-like cAMP-binding protein
VFNEQDKSIFLSFAEKAKIQEFAAAHIDSDRQKMIEDQIDEAALGSAMRKAIRASIDVVVSPKKPTDAAGGESSEKREAPSEEQQEAAETAANNKLKAVVLAQKFFRGNSPDASIRTKGPNVLLKLETTSPSHRQYQASGRNRSLSPTNKASTTAVDDTDEINSYAYLADILNSCQHRSRASRNVLATALKEETELGAFIEDCSANDLSTLAQECYLKNYDNKNEQVTTQGSNINGVHVIIKGSIKVKNSRTGEMMLKKKGELLGEALLEGMRTWDVSIFAWKGDNVHFCIIPADTVLQCIGVRRAADTHIYMQCFWKYTHMWPLFADPRSASQQVRDSVQSISFSVSQHRSKQSIAMAFNPSSVNAKKVDNDVALAAESESVANIRRKEVGDPDMDAIQSSDKQESSVQESDDVTTESLVSELRPTVAPPQPMEPSISAAHMKESYSSKVIHPCRVHCYQAGADIFRCGEPRHYLYVVTKGECALVRTVAVHADTSPTINRSGSPQPKTADTTRNPSPTTATSPNGRQKRDETVNNIEIDVGQRLLPGDFCFMDGESGNWFDKHDEAISRKIVAHHNTPILFRRHNLFGEHKHTLLALTRTEVCVLPIQNVYECGAVFIRLLKLMNESYPTLGYTDIQLLAARAQNMVFAGNRPRLVTQMINQSVGRIPTNEAIVCTHNRKDKMFQSYLTLMKEHNELIQSAKQALSQAEHHQNKQVSATKQDTDRKITATGSLSAGPSAMVSIPAPPSDSRPSSALNPRKVQFSRPGSTKEK